MTDGLGSLTVALTAVAVGLAALIVLRAADLRHRREPLAGRAIRDVYGATGADPPRIRSARSSRPNQNQYRKVATEYSPMIVMKLTA